MKTRRLRFTAAALEHVRRENAWWLANRDHVDVFTEELERALQIVSALPGAGTLYAQSPVPGVRRVYLRRGAAHLYYTFDNLPPFWDRDAVGIGGRDVEQRALGM